MNHQEKLELCEEALVTLFNEMIRANPMDKSDTRNAYAILVQYIIPNYQPETLWMYMNGYILGKGGIDSTTFFNEEFNLEHVYRHIASLSGMTAEEIDVLFTPPSEDGELPELDLSEIETELEEELMNDSIEDSEYFSQMEKEDIEEMKETFSENVDISDSDND